MKKNYLSVSLVIFISVVLSIWKRNHWINQIIWLLYRNKTKKKRKICYSKKSVITIIRKTHVYTYIRTYECMYIATAIQNNEIFVRVLPRLGRWQAVHSPQIFHIHTLIQTLANIAHFIDWKLSQNLQNTGHWSAAFAVNVIANCYCYCCGCYI